MRISKEQLRQIIKEELGAVSNAPRTADSFLGAIRGQFRRAGNRATVENMARYYDEMIARAANSAPFGPEGPLEIADGLVLDREDPYWGWARHPRSVESLLMLLWSGSQQKKKEKPHTTKNSQPSIPRIFPMGPLGGTRSMELEESFKMKITKAKLKQIIKEELEVTLTNEEAAEIFGEGVRAQLEEQQLNEILSPEQAAELPMVIDGLLGMSYTFAAPMLAALLARLGFEAGATAMAKAALERKDKNWLMNFLYSEVTGKQSLGDAEREHPMAPPPPPMMEQEKVSTDVARATKGLERVSGLEGILASINNRAEFEQLLNKFIQMVAKEKLQPNDVKAGVRNVAQAILKGK